MINSVLIISPEYPTETSVGGIGTYVYYMAKQFHEYDPKIKVTVLNISYDQYQDYDDEGVRVIRLKVNRNNIINRFWKYTSWLIKNYAKYDVIEDEIFGGWTFFVRLILGKKYKYVARIHGTSNEIMILERYKSLFKVLKNKLTSTFEKYLTKHATVVIFESSLAKNAFSFAWDIDLSKTFVIPMAFIYDEKRVLQIPKQFEDMDYFLFFGRIQKKKGSEVLKDLVPQLLNKYKNMNFVFVGTDLVNMKETFLDNKRVIFVDFIQDKNIWLGIISKAKVVILPSLFESFLYTAAESICINTPTVLSSNCGISEYLTQYEDYKNVVSNPTDPELYLSVVHTIMSQYELSTKYARLQSVALKEALCADTVVKKYLAILEKFYE